MGHCHGQRGFGCSSVDTHQNILAIFHLFHPKVQMTSGRAAWQPIISLWQVWEGNRRCVVLCDSCCPTIVRVVLTETELHADKSDVSSVPSHNWSLGPGFLYGSIWHQSWANLVLQQFYKLAGPDTPPLLDSVTGFVWLETQSHYEVPHLLQSEC